MGSQWRVWSIGVSLINGFQGRLCVCLLSESALQRESREDCEEGIAVIWVRGEGMDQGDSSGCGKSKDSGYIMRLEGTDFAEGLNVRDNRKMSQK